LRMGLIAGALALASSAVFANSGQITHLSGTLSAKKADGSVRILSLRSEIAAGETLTTEKDTYANVRFADGGNMTIKPNSSIRFEKLVYDPSRPKEDSFAATLIAGGLRMITGLIGQRSRDNFRMGTSNATIGIRGTTFNVDDCVEGSTGCGNLPPGVYVGVTDGSVEVSNPAGRMVVGTGQFSVIGRNAAPRETTNPGLAFTPPPAFSAPGASGPKAGDCVIRR
ncbi:MAG: FecR domain-containing protein, partial [Verrucomicrobia bacterium]|nr:FecR domain-containing protein [Verrucomicrobiota bacterium]